MKQNTTTILMIRPCSFGFNEETAQNNVFQNEHNATNLQQLVLREFDQMVQLISDSGVEVVSVEDTPEPVKPDAVFPNNWISFSHDGTVRLYPMYAENRRKEVRKEIVEKIGEKHLVSSIQDYTHYASERVFLEGTGSVVFDHSNQKAYASKSLRTDENLFKTLCEEMKYTGVYFSAVDKGGNPIYHTNVIMSIGSSFALLCTDSLVQNDRSRVIDSLRAEGKELVEISFNQLYNFAGNALELENKKGDKITVISRTAYDSLSGEQRQRLESKTNLLPVSIPTIEKIGGGSVRCMIAEVFLPKK